MRLDGLCDLLSQGEFLQRHASVCSAGVGLSAHALDEEEHADLARYLVGVRRKRGHIALMPAIRRVSLIGGRVGMYRGNAGMKREYYDKQARYFPDSHRRDTGRLGNSTH
jgi:hypothetical protein